MAIHATCPDCRAEYNFKDGVRGKSFRCKKCSKSFLIGAEESAVKPPDQDASPMPERATAVTAVQPRPARQDEEIGALASPRRRQRRRDKAREQAKAINRKILLIAGSVAGVLLLVVSAGLGWHFYHKKGTDKIADNFQEQPDGDSQHPPRDIDAALKSLRSANSNDRRSAADWLAKQSVDARRRKEVANALDPLLADSDADMRSAALQALLVWATKDNVPAIIRILKHEAAGQQLDQEGELAMDISAALEDPRLAPEVARCLAIASASGRARKTREAIGSAAEVAVVKYLFHSESGARREAQALLAGWKTADVIIIHQVLIEFQGADKTRRRLAAGWLEKAKPDETRRSEVASALDPLLNDGDDGVQNAALRAAVGWAAKVNVPTLVKIVQDKQDRNRKLAMQVLGKLKDAGGAAAVAARLPILSDRPEASRALREMGPVATTAVTKYLDHADADVREEAKKILTSYNSKDNLRLTKALDDIKSPDAELRRACVAWFAQAQVFEPRRAEGALALQGLLKDKDPEIRQAAIRALVNWATKDNVPALIELLTNKDKDTRRLAMETLGKLKDERAVAPVAARLLSDTDRKHASASLVAMGSICQEVVARALTNAHRGVRLEACMILQKVGTKEIVKALEDAARIYSARKDAELAAAAQAAAEAAAKR